MRRFLERSPHFPKDTASGEIRPQTIVRLLGKSVYAGYVSAPKWGISTREGHHEGLISKATFERIQERMNEGVYAPTRKDIKEDFPLRGAVTCASCSTPLTAGWCKGKCQKYPYYFCRKKGCDLHGKMIARKKIEGEFVEQLRDLQPSETLFRLVHSMFVDAWKQRTIQMAEAARDLKRRAHDVKKNITSVIDMAARSSNPRLISSYENRIEQLERQKLILAEQSAKSTAPRYTFEQLFEHCMRFISSPCKIWESGRFELQRLTLRLCFSGHLIYCRERGFLNTNLSLPFRALGSFLRGAGMNGAARERKFELSLRHPARVGDHS